MTRPTTSDSGFVRELRRHRPRTCIGCRSVRERADLVRLCLTATGEVTVGLGGRGAWLCADSVSHCLAGAVKRGGFRRAFRQPVPETALVGLPEALGLDVARGSGQPPR